MSYLIDIDSDYVGYWSISTSTYSSDDFETFIDQYEKMGIEYIFGKKVYKDIKNDPDQQKYIDLLDNGFKEYLLGYTYFGYIRDNFEQTNVGNVVLNAENSTGVGNAFNSSISVSRFNTGVCQFNQYTLEFLEDYGQIDEEVISSVESGGVSTLTVSDTKYLKNGDTIEIGLDEFTVSNVTATTFDITTTIDYTGEVATWYPFGEDYKTTKQNLII